MLFQSPEGCAAELARRPATPEGYLVGTLKVTLEKVCDLTNEETLDSLGLTKDQLITDDWTDTQVLGTLIREAGFEAIIVPSAAGDFNNLVIFMDRMGEKSKITIEDVQPLA